MKSKGIDFSHVPTIYWSPNVKISYLQRRIIVYSIMYYELDESVITDKEYDAISKQLVEMQYDYPEEAMKSDYYYMFYDFDGSTGFDLYDRLSKKDKAYLTKLAKYILKLSKVRS